MQSATHLEGGVPTVKPANILLPGISLDHIHTSDTTDIDFYFNRHSPLYPGKPVVMPEN